jgi:hypothetical protein
MTVEKRRDSVRRQFEGTGLEVTMPLLAVIRINPSHSPFFVHRVCQQQDGAAEKQRKARAANAN